MDILHVVFGGQSHEIDIDRLDLDLETASSREVKEAVERVMGLTAGSLYDHVYDPDDMSVHPKATYG